MGNTYYNTGNIRSSTLDTPDQDGAIYYYYKENGEVRIKVLSVVDGNGKIAYTYPEEAGYDNANYSDPDNPKVW
jgi:hypothetical protein